MATILVSYATTRFFVSQQRLNRSALNNGIDVAISFNSLWLKLFRRDFFKEHKKILRAKRGAGYWLWKPYIILEALKVVRENDFLIYLDAGIEIIRPLNPLFKLCEENDGLLLFSTFYFQNQHWTKRDAFVLMDCEHPKFREAKQLDASALVLQKRNTTVSLIKEWLENCTNSSVINDEPNRCGLPDFPGFEDHRHDQSILSLLAVKHNLAVFRSPHQFANNIKPHAFREPGEFLDNNPKLQTDIRGRYGADALLVKNSPYHTLFNHHRDKNSLKTWRLPFILLKMMEDAWIAEKWLTNEGKQK